MGAGEAQEDSWESAVRYVKKKERSDLKLKDWDVSGFATARAAEFDAACAREHLADRVARLPRGATYEQFAEVERGGRIAVIDGAADGWAPRDWTFEGLQRDFGNERFKVGKADDGTTLRLSFNDFAAYARSNADDSPLYVFDSTLGGARVRPVVERHYSVPAFFPDDYMNLIKDRPPFQWLLAGPKRSGTCVHIDPLATNAWNTLLVGTKKWAFLHPSVPRHVAKGKTVLAKGEDDEAVNFFVDIVPRLRAKGVEVIEVIQRAGETIFVPGNWWHCVVNVTDTVGVTQNYCGRNNFDAVWRSARVERPCMSVQWLAAMEERRPDLAARAKELNAADAFDMTALLKENKVRRRRKIARHMERALRKAKGRAREGPVDDEAFRAEYAKKHPVPDDDSTVSTSTSESETDSDTSDSATDSDSSDDSISSD